MNAIQLSNHLHEAFVNYLSTILDVNRDGQEAVLEAAIQASFRTPQALMRGPFLEITPPYKRGASINQLCNEGILSNQWRSLSPDNLPIPLDAPLYTHQEQAIRNYADGRSMVISSGTGSGKTEGFLIPILDDLLRDDSPGVRAVLIYPMNALVNDQLDRLRRLLRGTNITFGRYTSELVNKEKEGRKEGVLPNEVVSRETIRDKSLIPQILITNYAMLEYLLLRPEDSPLFESGKWRFLVLDEAHTYAGAQGTEVAFLIRRLKQRLRKNQRDMICIATSATLTDDRSVAAQFAKDIFNEPFEDRDILLGQEDEAFVPDAESYDVDPNGYLKEELDDLLDDLKKPDANLANIAQRMTAMELVPQRYSRPSDDHSNLSAYLWDALRGNPHLKHLRQRQPGNRTGELHDIAEDLFGDSLKPSDRLRALYNLIELGSLARPNDKSASMVSARYHVFMRPPQGIWVCLNLDCSGKHENTQGWSRVFATKRERCDSCSSLVYPLVVCRDCGQPYVQTWYADHCYHAEDVIGTGEKRYFLWREPKANLALANDEDQYEDEETSLADQGNKANLKVEKHKFCLNCGKEDARQCCKNPVEVELYRVAEVEQKRNMTRLVPLTHLGECLRCGGSVKDNEIATPVTISGSTPLSVLTTELYKRLPAISNQPGGGRKLLTFYDSRQGAAGFAAFLQDVNNEQHYNHIIPEVVCQIEANKGYPPNFDTTVEEAVQFGWDERLYHHDETLKDKLSLDRKRPNQNDRSLLGNFWRTIILAEFTSRRKRRQSLETLGVVGVRYFEDESEFDVSELVPLLQMTPEQIKSVIEFLLDELRHSKVIDFPAGVSIDDERFGRNVSNSKIVIRNAQRSEIAWIGQTDRHRRKRYMQKALKALGKPHDMQSVEQALTHIWNWLTASAIFVGTPQSGYQIDFNHVFLSTELDWSQCQQCQRLYARRPASPCPHPRCEGSLKSVDVRDIQDRNYFYQNMQRGIIPMRVEEHTAQLSSDKGREYQDKFRNGEINVLSCSTTFEMGIDLGDLQSVVMSNVPPTVANYRQRSGRAGRRAGGAAFILTWADERPHDQTYFKNPIQIIEGRVKVPYIALDNVIIEQRHMNAVLFSAYMRYRRDAGHDELSKVAPFFEPTRPERHFDGLSRWMQNRSHVIRDMLHDYIDSQRYQNDEMIGTWLRGFDSAMKQADDEYQKRYTYYTQQIEGLLQRITSQLSQSETRSYRQSEDEFRKLRDRLNDEEAISFLSDKGILPSYSFPLHTVELILPVQSRQRAGLKLQRDLKQAIREYAPGSEIVADKRIWRSAGVRFYRGNTVVFKQYAICEYCNHLRMSEIEGGQLSPGESTCPVCKQNPRRGRKSIKRFITPDDFFAGGSQNDKPAGQYVKRLKSDMRSALIPGKDAERYQLNQYVQYTYQRQGQLLYVNEGEHGNGFKLSLVGDNIGHLAKTADAVSLGHEQNTDVLHLYFVGDIHLSLPGLEDQSFWLSLMYALIQGASRALQIERKDIDGVLSPQNIDGQWRQAIVLYDNVPGGAGHVKHIQDEFRSVLKEALNVLNCDDCSPDTSCYRCLRDYNNQFYHTILKREDALKYLELLYYADPVHQHPIIGAGHVMTLNPAYWLLQQVQNARHHVSIWVDQLSVEPITGSQYDWLDVLQDCLRRGVQVELNLKSDLSEDWVLIHYLRHLLNRGLQLRRIEALPEWHLLLDESDKAAGRVIQIQNTNGDYVLGDDIEGLISTSHPEGVQQARDSLASVRYFDLELPSESAKTQVITIENGQITDEQALFAEYFQKPVTSLYINDPYLTNRYRIVNRLGEYLRLATDGGGLHTITVVTAPDDRNKPSQQQKSAFQSLQAAYGDRLKVRYSGAEHDRYVDLKHEDGTHTRIIIGRGLDFIQPDGKCLKTYITIDRS